MKKLFCAVFLFLILSSSVPVGAESSFSVSGEVVKSALESSLENGFSPYKNIQAMLDNAMLNGYDHFNVKYNETSNSLWIEVAIKGLSSALKSLENSKSEDAFRSLIQSKETVTSHCYSIIGLLKMLGRDDMGFILEIIDDGPFYEYGIADMNLVMFRAVDGEAKIIYSKIEAWKESE